MKCLGSNEMQTLNICNCSYLNDAKMDSCAPGLTSWNFLFSLKLYPPVCKPENLGRGIAIRAKVE